MMRGNTISFIREALFRVSSHIVRQMISEATSLPRPSRRFNCALRVALPISPRPFSRTPRMTFTPLPLIGRVFFRRPHASPFRCVRSQARTASSVAARMVMPLETAASFRRRRKSGWIRTAAYLGDCCISRVIMAVSTLAPHENRCQGKNVSMSRIYR